MLSTKALNGQNYKMKNVKDFIDFHAEKNGMTREEYSAYYLGEAMETGKGWMNQKELIKFLSKLPKDFKVSIPSPGDNGKYVYFDSVSSRTMEAKEAIKWLKKYKPELVPTSGELSAKIWKIEFPYLQTPHSDMEGRREESAERRKLTKSLQIGSKPQLLDGKLILKNIDRFESLGLTMTFSNFDHDAFADAMSRSGSLD